MVPRSVLAHTWLSESAELNARERPCVWQNAHTGGRTPVASMGGLYDAAALCTLEMKQLG